MTTQDEQLAYEMTLTLINDVIKHAKQMLELIEKYGVEGNASHEDCVSYLNHFSELVHKVNVLTQAQERADSNSGFALEHETLDDVSFTLDTNKKTIN